jgi:hypothetical protein
MELTQYISYGSAALVTLAGILFQESAKEIIKKFFSGLSRGQINALFYSLLALAAFGAYYAANLTTDQKATVPVAEVRTEEPRQGKSDAEVLAEVAPQIIETGKEIVASVKENKQKKDSICEATRPKMWACQLGAPVSGEKALWKTFKELKNIPNVFAFKESRRTYTLVKGWFDTEEAARNAADELKQETAALGMFVKAVDLSALCSRKEKIIKSEDVTSGKEDTGIPCYICDN